MADQLTKDTLRILVVDNYDSFTFNLVHYLEDIIQKEVNILRVDDAREADILSHDVIVFSPGPGLPHEFDNLLPLVHYAINAEKRILGVCLGHQALAVATGGSLKNLDTVYHGVSHPISVLGSPQIFRGFSLNIMVGRYHSWVVESDTLSKDWRVTATDSEGETMAMEHANGRFCGIQFHPESVLTPDGKDMLRNFLEVISD